MTFGEMEMKPLEDMIPSLNIFESMSGVSFITGNTVAQYLDQEYFYNHSGRKIASPLVCRLFDAEDSSYVTTLASIITNRYKPKWEQLFSMYSGLSTHSLLDNVGYKKETTYGKFTHTVTSDDVEKKGTETKTDRGEEITTERYPSDNKRTTKTIVSGSYADEDTRASARTGSQKVTDKGDTKQSVYGFNSSTAVPSSISGPNDATNGVTSETTFGENGLIDTNSGFVTRRYGVDEGDEGLVTQVEESGEKSITKSYGQNGKARELSFTGRKDERDIEIWVNNDGKDTEENTGFNHKSLVTEVLMLLESEKMLDFLNIVFDDVDEVLTLPVFM